jgi:hypothetical protein
MHPFTNMYSLATTCLPSKAFQGFLLCIWMQLLAQKICCWRSRLLIKAIMTLKLGEALGIIPSITHKHSVKFPRCIWKARYTTE